MPGSLDRMHDGSRASLVAYTSYNLLTYTQLKTTVPYRWLLNIRYGDIRYEVSADNTAENSSVFSLIQMRWLLSARACGQ